MSIQTRTIVTSTAAAALAGFAAYAIYFDWRRRNDAEFRLKLARENNKLQRAAKVQASQAKEADTTKLRAGVKAIESEPKPSNPGESEQYFLEQVGMGEALAGKGPNYYVDSALSFFRALRVYPAPHDLIEIYQKTLPPQVFEYIMTAFVLSQASARGPSGNAILEEIDDGNDTLPLRPKAGSRTASPTSPTSSQGANGGFVHVEEKDD